MTWRLPLLAGTASKSAKRSSLSWRRQLRLEQLEDRLVLATVPNGFTETVVASNLTSPITMDIDDGGRIWLAYQDGRIEVIENDSLLPQIAYQLDCDGSGERGLQGIELDPHFEHNGYIYVYYTAASPASHNRLSRLTVDPTTENSIIPGSEVVLLDLPNLSTVNNPIWHMGGNVSFLPDGTIVVQIGDHQGTVVAQNMDLPFGKVLRVNPNGSPASDNPYYNAGDGITWRDYIWASGLRNPFSGDVDPMTGRYFIADVGQSAAEEINEATNPGLNFGWPTTEGNFNPVTYPNFTNPFYAYSHAGGQCAITGAAFYSPAIAQFPAEYQGKFFFSEFCGGTIQVIDPNNPNDVEVFISDSEFPMNIEFAGDGSMYYIARGAGAGGNPGIGTGQIVKVQYAAQIAPEIVTQPLGTLVSVGYDAIFNVGAAGTPPLDFQWQRWNGTEFEDVGGATAATLTMADVSLADDGAQVRVVVTNSFGSATSNVVILDVTSDTPPTPVINLPADGVKYRAGDEIPFSGAATDLEDVTLSASAMTWQVDFHHGTHLHPFMPPTTGITGGSFTIPTNSETAPDVWYRVRLVVTDSTGLTTEVTRDIHPERSDFLVTNNLSGGEVLVDGQTKTAPHSVTGVVNVTRSLEAPAQQTASGNSASFFQWLDGETERVRVISTPEGDTAYVALYRTFSGTEIMTYVSDMTPTLAVNGWGPVEFDESVNGTAAGDGNPITLNGVVYPKGLGVHADSDVRFDLNGSFSRFISDIGIDDETNNGSVIFRVFGDGVLLFESGLMTGTSATQTVDVDVTGVDVLQLVVDDNGNKNSDHADWAGARVLANAVYLSDLTPTQATNGWGPIEFDTSNGEQPAGDGDPITLNGVIYDKGLGVHANSDVRFALGGAYRRFISDIGLDDEKTAGNVIFRVYGDGNLLYDSGVMIGTTATKTLNVDVTGVQELRLVVDQNGSTNSDHADWADARLLTSTAGDEILPLASADVTLNGKVTYADALAFAAGWGTHGGGISLADLAALGDLNFDSATDQSDWDLFHDAWLDAGMPPISLAALLNPIDGDFNRDGTVDNGDYNRWRADFGSSAEVAADGNGNNVVDTADYTVWRDNVGNTLGAGGGGSSPAGVADTPPTVASLRTNLGNPTESATGQRRITTDRGTRSGPSVRARSADQLLLAIHSQRRATVDAYPDGALSTFDSAFESLGSTHIPELASDIHEAVFQSLAANFAVRFQSE